eukprot:4299184-Prymnesium_polylepis.1
MEYSSVLERVSPLESKNAELQVDLDSSQERLDKCKGALELLDKKVVDLKKDFSKRTAEAESLKASLQKAEEVLGAAQELLEKLSGERKRWDGQMKELMGASSALPANALLSAGFLAYLADEQEGVRAEMLADWVEALAAASLLPASVKSTGFSLLHFLSSEGELLRWKSQGLPTDKLSSENAIVILKAHLTPLIIDPSSQATRRRRLDRDARAARPALRDGARAGRALRQDRRAAGDRQDRAAARAAAAARPRAPGAALGRAGGRQANRLQRVVPHVPHDTQPAARAARRRVVARLARQLLGDRVGPRGAAARPHHPARAARARVEEVDAARGGGPAQDRARGDGAAAAHRARR